MFLFGISTAIAVCQDQGNPKDTEQWEPEPAVVTPGENGSPSSDAVVLFSGSDFDQWEHLDGSPVEWTIEDNAMIVQKGKGNIRTKSKFGSVQLHIEWRTPSQIEGEGQGRGNSGIFFQEKYELQVLDSYNNRTYSNGQAASIYKQSIPLVNASRSPGSWQSYDVIFHAPTFESGNRYKTKPTITVLHNGVLVQDHTTIQGTTEYIGAPKVIRHGDGHLMLQDHSNPTAFRNIWLRRLD